MMPSLSSAAVSNAVVHHHHQNPHPHHHHPHHHPRHNNNSGQVASNSLAGVLMGGNPLLGSGGNGGQLGGIGGGPPSMAAQHHAMSSTPLCKFYVSGGCLRGESCPFLHELPDERHLDVNGVGFIFNSNAQNTQNGGGVRPPPATTGHLPSRQLPSLMPSLPSQGGQTLVTGNLSGGMVPPWSNATTTKAALERYRPPPVQLEGNLSPVLAAVMRRPDPPDSAGLDELQQTLQRLMTS